MFYFCSALKTGWLPCRKLDVLNALDPRWRHANTLERIDSGGEALMFNKAIGFIQSLNSKATDEVVAGAIAAMRPTSTLARLLDRFLQRADQLPPHPIASGDNELRPLLSMRDLLDAGRRYRNCLRHRLADVAVGRMALAEFRGECLVEFRPLTAGVGWLLRDVHIERNRPVPLSLLADVEAKCDEFGIPRINEAEAATVGPATATSRRNWNGADRHADPGTMIQPSRDGYPTGGSTTVSGCSDAE